MRRTRARVLAALSFVALVTLGTALALQATGPRVPDAVDRTPDLHAAHVDLTSDGLVSITAPRRAARALGPVRSPATRAALRDELAGGPSSRTAGLALRAGSDVPWAEVLEVVGIAREGRHCELHLARTDAPDDGVRMAVAPGIGFPDVVGGDWTLPIAWVRIGRLAAGGREAPAMLEVRVVVVDVPIGDVGALPEDLDALPWRTAWAVRADVRGLVEAARRRGERVEHAVLDVPAPLRSRVTFGGVLEVLHGLADADLASIAPRDG